MLALRELVLGGDEVSVEILEFAKSGFLGLGASLQVRIIRGTRLSPSKSGAVLSGLRCIWMSRQT